MIEHRTQNWTLAKPAAPSRLGVVVSQSGTAAEVGAQMLRRGGNAVDAAVATAFALAATEPWNSGLGGVGFMVVHRAGAARAEVVDFGPISPAGAEASLYPLAGGTSTEMFGWPLVEGGRNARGPLSFAVPGAVDGLGLALERWGRLGLPEVVAPAIELAERGLPVDWYTTIKVAASAAVLRRSPTASAIYLPDGLPPVAAEGALPRRLNLGALARTLKSIATAGRRDAYEGEVARLIVADAAAAGAVLSAGDLASYRARIVAPLEVDYRGHTVQAPGGLTAGPTLAFALERLSRLPVADGPGLPAAYRGYADALAAAYRERLARHGEAALASTSTTHVGAIDGEGNCVALTNTLLSSFGSAHVLPQTGILMNNGMLWFDPRPGGANAIGPSRRPLSNMCPVVVARGGVPELTAGASGGRKIVGAVLQLLSFAIDFGLDPVRAAHQPRIDVSGADTLLADARLDPAVLQVLRGGHSVATVEHGVWPAHFACPSLVARSPGGLVDGVSDAMSPWSAAAAA